MHGALIFSDLDGTFLDADYTPVLEREAAREVFARHRVVWVSSRTADELLELQRSIAYSGDAIGENGGVFVTHDHSLASRMGEPDAIDSAWVVRLGAPFEQTDAKVRSAFAATGAPLTTLHDLGAAELARRSGYGVSDAERALRRRTSVLLVDSDMSDARVTAAFDALRRDGAAIAHGGKWVSVVQGADKGTAVRAYLAAWNRSGRPAPDVVAAIGDADNDEPLLKAVDLPFVVRRPHRGHAPALARIAGARLLEQYGPAGWLEMLEYLHAIAGERR